MKKKNLFMTLGLALSLGVGVAAGLSANQNVREASARGYGTDTGNYVYYVTESASATTDQIYAWNGSGNFGEWPGTSIASVGTDVTGVFKFEGTYKKIYKIEFDEAPTNFILTWGKGGDNGEGGKTADLTYNCGSAYWWYGDVNGVATAGAAIDLLIKVENARNIASSFEGHSYSICGINPQKAADLYNEYYALADGAKTMVNNSTTKTYNGKNSSGVYDWNENENISFSNIMQQLKKIALDAGKTVSGEAARVVPTTEVTTKSNTSLIVIIAVSAIAVLALGGYFFIRSRKED